MISILRNLPKNPKKGKKLKKPISIVLIFCFIFYLFGCSSNGLVNLENPPAGASVKINLIDGTSKTGVLLKKKDQIIKYIDTQTGIPEDLDLSGINNIEYSKTEFDLSGKTISENEISTATGMGKTLGYGFGGLLIGGLIGFGAGALFSSTTDEGTALIYPIIGFGVAGAVFLGIKGSELDREDAIDEIRKDRYSVTQRELNEELERQKKELEKQKKDLEKLKEKQNPESDE
jgi:hypothetical protein